MANGRYNRGVGSNQFRERAGSITDQDERRAAIEKMEGREVPPLPVRATSAKYNGTLRSSLGGHKRALSGHMESALSLPEDMPDAEARMLLQKSASRVAAAEDAILGRHPDLYGDALVSANNFVTRAEHDPMLRRLIAEGDPEATRVMNASRRLLDDAENPTLDVDGISQTISEMEGGEKWSAISDEQSQADSEDKAMCRRAAALFAASSRSSDPAEKQALERELETTNMGLRDYRLRHFG